MVDINIELQKSLPPVDPDMEAALALLEEFKEISVARLMFKKQPQIVETIRSFIEYPELLSLALIIMPCYDN